MREQARKQIISWAITIGVAVVAALLVNAFLILNVTVPTGSMEDTIAVNDRLIAFRQSYAFSDPKIGDVIVFRYPDNRERNFIKRVIGLPGDTVYGEDGVVYVNDEPLEEPYIKEPANEDFGPFVVPEGHYFVMGDNRNNSADSRAWKNKYVPEEDILGKAKFSYYPKIEWIN